MLRNWFLRDITAHVETPPINLINIEQVGFNKESGYVKVKLYRNPVSETSETYEVKLALF